MRSSSRRPIHGTDHRALSIQHMLTSMDIDQLLERTQWDLFWTPPGVSIIDRPELLLLRHPQGTQELNAVHRLRAPDHRLSRLIEEISHHHSGRSSRVQLYPSNIRPSLSQALTDAGYALTHEHLAYTLATNTRRPPLPEGLQVQRVSSLEHLRDACRVRSDAFGSDDALPAEDMLRRYLTDCTGARARVHRFVVYERASRQPLSAGGMTTFPALSFGFLWSGGTVPEGRNRGAYTALVTARMRQAAALGIERVGLYARLRSSAPILARQGFTPHGPMHHWIRP